MRISLRYSGRLAWVPAGSAGADGTLGGTEEKSLMEKWMWLGLREPKGVAPRD